MRWYRGEISAAWLNANPFHMILYSASIKLILCLAISVALANQVHARRHAGRSIHQIIDPSFMQYCFPLMCQS